MKRSRQICLLVSASLLAPLTGCSPKPGVRTAGGAAPDWGDGTTTASFDVNQEYPNNTYVNGLGYYHSYYHWWYPHPWNYYTPGFGYYGGGSWNSAPLQYATLPSRPDPSRSYSYFNRNGGTTSSGFSGGRSVGSSGSSGESSGGTSRGGFGASGHGGGGGE